MIDHSTPTIRRPFFALEADTTNLETANDATHDDALATLRASVAAVRATEHGPFSADEQDILHEATFLLREAEVAAFGRLLQRIWAMGKRYAQATGDMDFANCTELHIDEDEPGDVTFFGSRSYSGGGVDSWIMHMPTRLVFDEDYAVAELEREQATREVAADAARSAQERAEQAKAEREQTKRRMLFETLRAEFQEGQSNAH